MKYADLHIHSNYSDGMMIPEEIVEIAKSKKVKYISITDHDSIASQYITKKNYEDITIIPGIELSTEYNDLEIHILGYFIDIENANLKKVVDMLSKERRKRVENILFKLKAEGINLTLDDIGTHTNSTIGRSHVANAMVRKGYFDNYKTAFTTYLVKGKPAFVRGYKLDCKETIEIINNAGGIAVLAHPGQIYRGMIVESVIKELKCYGIKGLEVYHPCHHKNQINYFYNLAKKNRLYITGGSDYHGNDSLHHTGVGSFGINELLLNKLIKFKKNKLGV